MDKSFEREPTPKTRMTAQDFVVQIIHYAAEGRGGIIMLRMQSPEVHQALKTAYETLHERAEDEGLDLRFAVALQDGGTSDMMRGAMSNLLGWRMARGSSWDDSLIYSSENEANRIQVKEGNLPGGPDVFEKLAQDFLIELERPQQR